MPETAQHAVLSFEQSRELILRLKTRLKSGSEALRAAYEARPLTDPILKGRSHLVDEVLVELWQTFGLPDSAALVACRAIPFPSVFRPPVATRAAADRDHP